MDEGDDEETLKLQLQAIEAKLKLKKIQKKRQEARPDTELTTNKVQVLFSPKRNAPPPAASQSPRRTQLGIDKGLKAADVSLKNARNTSSAQTAYAKEEAHDNAPRRALTREKPTSFAERLLASRNQDKQRSDKQVRSQESRSRSFGVPQAMRRQEKENSEPEYQPRNTYSPVDTTKSSLQKAQSESRDHDPYSKFALSKRNLSASICNDELQDKEPFSIPRLLKEVTSPDYDQPDVSGDYVVFGIIASKSKPRDHAETHKTSSENGDQPQRSKFMVIRLTDLEWELDLYLFGKGFDTFWKLTVGTVIAVLNPGIMPPKPHMRDTGRFSLKLGSSNDTVLEIGNAADLAFCKSVKADGQLCGTWVDRRKTEYCEFHVGLQVARSKSQRMEINTMGSLNLFQKSSDKRGRSGGGERGKGSSGHNPFSVGGRRSQQNEKNPKTQGRYYDREAHSAAYSLPSSMQKGTSTAKLLDAEDYGPHAGLSAAERSRKRRAAQEKERDLAQALGREGSGLGVEYIRSAHEERSQAIQRLTTQQHTTSTDDTKDASSFGLVRSKLNPISLDPVNGRKSRKEAVGWSKAFKRGLSPSASTKSPSPKKARFMLDGKGMRTPGCDSVPDEKQRANEPDDDDDGLELV